MEDSRTEDYLRLLSKNERQLSAYVHSLVNHRADAEEILQEMKVVLWKKFEDFEMGTNFPAWAKKVALGLILNYRRSNKRRKTMPAEIQFIEAVAEEMDRIEQEEDVRSDALENCLRKLPAAQRQMILWRYYEEQDIPQIARQTDRTETAVYRMLSRIRKILQDCIERELVGT